MKSGTSPCKQGWQPDTYSSKFNDESQEPDQNLYDKKLKQNPEIDASKDESSKKIPDNLQETRPTFQPPDPISNFRQFQSDLNFKHIFNSSKISKDEKDL